MATFSGVFLVYAATLLLKPLLAPFLGVKGWGQCAITEAFFFTTFRCLSRTPTSPTDYAIRVTFLLVLTAPVDVIRMAISPTPDNLSTALPTQQ
jgi:hypothetical protein